jgi:hypothetical protein
MGMHKCIGGPRGAAAVFSRFETPASAAPIQLDNRRSVRGQ